MDAFQSVKLSGSDILFSLHEFDPPISPVQDHTSTSGLDGGQIIQHVLGSARIKNAVTEVSRAEIFHALSVVFYRQILSLGYC